MKKNIIYPLVIVLTTCATSCILEKCDYSNYIHLKKQSTTSMTTKKLNLMDESTEGGTVEYFFDNQKLKIIKVKVYGEMGKVHIDYFIISSKSKSYFVSIEEFTYNSPIYEKDNKIIKKQKSEFFVCDEDNIKNISKEKYKKSTPKYIIRIYNKVNKMLANE